MKELKEMLEDLDTNITERIESLSEEVEDKLGIDGQEVVDDYMGEINNLKDRYPDRDKSTVVHQAWVRIKGNWQSELSSDAEVIEAVIVAAGDCYDPFRNRREEAKEMKEEDFSKAVKEGYINEDGEILSDRGSVIQDETYKRQTMGFYRKVGEEGEPNKFWMSLMGSNALNKDLPIMEPIRFRGEIADLDEGQGRAEFDYINLRRNADFEVIESEDLTPANVIESDFVQDKFVPLHEIPEIHDSQLGYGNRYATEGFVVFASDEPYESTGNMNFALSNEELGEKNYTVWVPEHLHDKMDFEPGSKVWVIGEINEGTFNDEKTFNIQAWGIHAYEDFKVDKSETQHNVEANDDFNDATEVY